MQLSLLDSTPSFSFGFLDGLDAAIDAAAGYDPDRLRYYQRDAVERTLSALQTKRSALIVMATGLGKTQTFSVLAKRWPGRVLVLAHRDELVGQARHRLEQITGEQIGVEQAEWRSGRERIVVGSTDTVKQKGRLAELTRKGGFSLVIVDEAHHYTAKTYRRPLDHFADAKVIGVTATPDRGDEQALGLVFEDVSYVFDIESGVAAGYLVPVIGERVYVEQVDLAEVKSVAGDLSASQLDEVMLKAVEGIVRETVARWPDRRGPAFFPGVQSAQLAAERFNALKPGSAAVVSGSTPKEERRGIMAAVKRGDIQYLCNCMVATEGFDWPDANLVIIGRPTKSRALYAQMAGRGTRVLPGVVDDMLGPDRADDRRWAIGLSDKPDCIIADFVGNAGKHQLVGPEDILGGNYTAAEVKKAKELAAKKPGRETIENLKAARKELQAMAKAMDAKVKARAERFDPFRVFGLDRDQPNAYEVKYGAESATPGQLSALEKFGVDPKALKTMSKRDAKKMLDECIQRKNRGLASYRQMRQLQRFGLDAKNVPFERASAAMNYLHQTGFGKLTPVDPHMLDKIVHRVRTPGEEG
jgi:superfamily II DNA or RNA helicase